MKIQHFEAEIILLIREFAPRENHIEEREMIIRPWGNFQNSRSLLSELVSRVCKTEIREILSHTANCIPVTKVPEIIRVQDKLTVVIIC